LRLLWFILPLIVWGQESFITHYEYGEMLYENPRGVSCSQCHGKKGEGKVIVEFHDEDGKQVLKGADIRKKSLEEIINSVKRYHEVMPRYYMTDDEVKAIYDYLQIVNSEYLSKPEEKDAKN